MNSAGFEWINWPWLLLMPFIWAVLIWWYKNGLDAKQQTSIIDIDLSAYNHFYHPFAKQFIDACKINSKQRVFWKQRSFWLNGIILSLLLSSLAQPVLMGKRLPDPAPERDIVFLVDTSISMQLRDYQYDGKPIKRIEVLRNLLDEFSIKMVGEKISIILFAENAYTLVPLSNDQNLIRAMLSRINTTLAGRYTAVGDALLMALNETQNAQARQSSKQRGDNKKRHQIFILFTDADTLRGKVSAIAAAKIIAEHQIPIFTIAIGSSENRSGKKITGGLYSAVDLDLLKEISQISKAESYQVNDSDSMQQALNRIFKQSQNVAIPKPQYEKYELYFYFLALALLILVLSQIFSIVAQIEASKTGSRQ